jgi:hypothetical protein
VKQDIRRPSWATHAYYRDAILPLMREAMGCVTENEAHRQIKAGFFGMHPDDPELPSMGRMPQEQAGRLIEYAMIEAAQIGVILPDPRRKTA